MYLTRDQNSGVDPVDRVPDDDYKCVAASAPALSDSPPCTVVAVFTAPRLLSELIITNMIVININIVFVQTILCVLYMIS